MMSGEISALACALGRRTVRLGVVFVAISVLPATTRAEEAGLTLAARSHADDLLFDEGFDFGIGPGVEDPWEPTNREMFALNDSIDVSVIEPMARSYADHVPELARESIANFLLNLNEPVAFANHVFQLEGERAVSTLVRFAVNTTFGLAGLFDPAAQMGLDRQSADFGQTLGKAGIGPGSYHVIPLVGPLTTRHLVGSIVDLALRPDVWAFSLPWLAAVEVAAVVPKRARHLTELDELRASSVDFYSTVRTAYLMSREAMVRDEERPPRRWIGQPAWGPQVRLAARERP